jgi:hypothetical protein
VSDGNSNDAFVQTLAARFNASVDALDAATASRITQIRHRALESGRRTQRLSVWVPAGVVAAVCLALLAYFIVVPPQRGIQQGAPAQATVPATDDMELISNLELYEDLEFYQWLEQYELPS